MKTAATCVGRVAPKLCQAAQEVLTDGETQSGFLARGLASRHAAHASGRYVKAATVLNELTRRLKTTIAK